MNRTVPKALATILVVGSWTLAVSADESPLSQARMGFKTHLSFDSREPKAPTPPASVFRKITYPSSNGPLPAYLTLNPKDGSRHPAIIWITGGDCNSIGDVWSPNPRNNDQTAAAYRAVGIVTMFPSLRGGNDNPGHHEGFYGEVDDVLAAFDYLSKQSYIDSKRIYLGGHSTGGTLALLTAEMRNPFRAVFAFGPVADVRSYGTDILPIDVRNGDEREHTLRSPVQWLSSARGQVFVIEGKDQPGNIAAVEYMQQHSQGSAVHFITLAGASHFSILAPANEVIAKQILNDKPSQAEFALSQTQLQSQFK